MIEKIKITSGKRIPYVDLLDQTQKYVSAEYSAEVSSLVGRDDSEPQMREIISRSLINLKFFSPSDSRLNEIKSRLYEDMAGMSFLSKYLNHLDKYSDLEEINGNWNSIHMKYTGGRTELKEESFLSPQHALDTIKRILQNHGGILDDATPEVTGDIGSNIRITAKKAPLIPESFGVYFSIRITRPHSITNERLVESGTVSTDIMEFLQTCVKYMISMVVSGKQYAGKTTMINFLLSLLPDNVIKYLIEEGSRELDLIKYDKDGRMINQVIPCLVRPSEDKKQNYDAKKELQFGLRYDSDVFVPQEMRAEEAVTAVECARTGSMVVSTTHSNDAASTYSRIMTLMQLESNQKEDTLMRLVVEAFPLIIHMARPKDGLPRVMEVLEGERYSKEDGLICRTLYRYAVEDNIENKDGSVKVIGHFERVHGISERLQRILLTNSAPKKLVDFYAKE
jgi:pilus assembly protein CpaF